jgi:hypothetical protein
VVGGDRRETDEDGESMGKVAWASKRVVSERLGKQAVGGSKWAKWGAHARK